VKRRVYLDTSVLSAIDEERWPDRAILTRAFWERREELDLCTSEVARQEIDDTADTARRAQVLARLVGVTMHPVTMKHGLWRVDMSRRASSPSQSSPTPCMWPRRC